MTENNNSFLPFTELLPPFLKAHSETLCWICNSCENISQEHRIKASDIRRQFGDQEMYIGMANSLGHVYKIVQSSKSKYLKFPPSICHKCNTSATQHSDLSYDLFVRSAEEKASSGADPQTALEDNYFLDENNFLALFRYFAKLMGCHLHESGVPIPLHLARFVARQTDSNCIWLSTCLNTGLSISAEAEGLAAHGGLVTITKEPTRHPIRFHSVRMIGKIRMVFWYDMTFPEICETVLRFPDFVERCAFEAGETMRSPTRDSDLKWLGLTE